MPKLPPPSVADDAYFYGSEREPTSSLVDRFTRRIVDDLVDNNVLRGAWAEQVVANFLPDWTFPGQWSYFDLVAPAGGHTMSVKHSAGKTPRFGVVRRKWAWDNRIMGWFGSDDLPPQQWCEVYTFAWLEAPLEQSRLLDPDEWLFAVLSRGDMYRLDEGSKTVGLGRLRELGAATVRGCDLQARVEAVLAEPAPPGVPALDCTRYEDTVRSGHPEFARDHHEPVVVTDALPPGSEHEER